MTSLVFMRKTHRILVLLITVIGLAMASTGTLIKFPRWTEQNLQWVDLGFARYLHNRLSIWFGVAFIAMMLTGLWMYIGMAVDRRRAKRRAHEQELRGPGL